MKYQSDIVIVGGGIAGIVSAIELLNGGKKVILLDRGTKNEFGGLAIRSFGGMFFVNTPQQRRAGMKDNVDLALRDWFAVAGFNKDDIIPKKWAEQYVNLCTPKVYEWLKNYGIKYFPVVHWVERGHFVPGNSYPRFHLVWGTGYELTKTLINSLLNHPKAASHLQIYFNHKVDEILLQNNEVIGVKGVINNSKSPFTATAETVIIAAGGMGGNIEKVKQHWNKNWGTPPKKILNGASIYADGTLHEAVKKINGNITHLDKNWHYAGGVHHPRPHFPNHGLSLVPCKSALWLDYTGKRFAPEPLVTAYDTKHLVETVSRQTKKYSWQIMNLKIANKEFAISGAEFNEAIRLKKWIPFLKSVLFGNKKLVKDMLDNCIDFVTANSIPELVNKMNELQGTNDVLLKNVQDAVTHYDDMVSRPKKFQNDEQLRRIAHTRQYRGDRVRTLKNQKIVDSKAMPLIAIREFILSRKTLGGIQTDLKSRVLTNPIHQKQHSIPNLYAVGEAAGFGGGGIHGKGTLEGTFLGSCILTSRIAAYDILGKNI